MKNEEGQTAELLDAGWEAEARRWLEPTGYDAELGVDAARDSLRVTAGELDEQEFYRRHHDAYVREFGVDDRPTGASISAAVEGTRSSGPQPLHAAESDDTGGIQPMLLSRRDALRFAGAGAAALFLGELLMRSPVGAGSAGSAETPGLTPANGAEPEHRSVRWGMVIDLERCNGCLACVHGCRQENGLPDGVHWIYPFAFADENREEPNYLVRPCMHCSNAPCVKVCPVAARHVREADGLVLTDYDICIGCRYCEVSCPYGANYFQWGEPSSYGGTFSGDRRDERGRSVIGDPPQGVMGKCNFCPQRLDETGTHWTTACALACPHKAIHAGDLNDPESAPRQYLAIRQAEDPQLSTFRLLDELGTQPNVIYIGQEPTRRARAVEGTTSYEDHRLVEERRTVLGGPDPWFLRVIKGE